MHHNDAQAQEEIFISATLSCACPSREGVLLSGFGLYYQKYHMRHVPGHQRLRLLSPAARRAQAGSERWFGAKMKDF